MWLSWHRIMFYILFWFKICKNIHFKGLYLFSLHQHTVKSNMTIRQHSCHITSIEQRFNNGYLSCLFSLNLLSYGELSIYVLLLRFGLSNQYIILDNTGWLFFIALHFVKRFVWYIFFISLHLLLILFLFGASTASPWIPLSRVSASY